MLKPRLANSMYSPRRIVVLIAVFFILWLFVMYVSDDTFPDHGVMVRPPRPDYLPFDPPPRGKVERPLRSWPERAESIKEAFLHAYRSYERFAPFPNDELLPLGNASLNNLNGWGLTMVDSLDTMLLLGLKDDFKRSLLLVEKLDFSMRAGTHAQFFETVIRYLGGLLSAYALSHEHILLERAEKLGEKLMPVFNSTSGMPLYAVNTETKETVVNGMNTMLFAEIASYQMEYKYLAYVTGREDFFDKADRVMDHLVTTQASNGMWPTFFNVEKGTPTNLHYSVGAWADSGYEYILKQYLLSSMTEHRLAEMYMNSMQGIIDNLIFLSRTRNLLYITDITAMVPTHKFEHLSCFFPGLLALGATTLPDSAMSPEERELHMWAAEGLAHTCWVMYADQPSGLSAEIVLFDGSGSTEEKWTSHLKKWDSDGRPGSKPPGVGDAGLPLQRGDASEMDYTLHTSSYLLRPETLESMFIMYRATGDVKWRNRGWQIWEAIEKKTRSYSGYTSVTGVENEYPDRMDSMPSYFLAETIKYAYLLTIEKDPWPASKYILNTEAHPLPVFKPDKP